MGNHMDLVGQRYGRRVVASYAERRGKHHYWNCLCDCGSNTVVATTTLRNARHQSCGCLAREMAAATAGRQRTHGQTVHGVWTPIYRCYRAMLARCDYPSQEHYADYGGRGITVCSRWRHGEDGLSGFECFRQDMGEKPSRAHSIDRRNVNGNYEPGNCRWATKVQQARNTRASKVTDDMAAEIRRRYAGGSRQVALAAQFGLSQAHVSEIIRRAD